jgi:hypothetical protein
LPSTMIVMEAGSAIPGPVPNDSGSSHSPTWAGIQAG